MNKRQRRTDTTQRSTGRIATEVADRASSTHTSVPRSTGPALFAAYQPVEQPVQRADAVEEPFQDAVEDEREHQQDETCDAETQKQSHGTSPPRRRSRH